MREYLEDWFQDLKSVLTGPSSFYEDLEDTSLGQSAKFAGITGGLFGLLFGLLGTVSVLLAPSSLTESAVVALGIFVFAPLFIAAFTVLNVVVSGAMMHAVAYVLGMRGIEKTIAAYTYSLATSVVGWIPVVNFFAGLYALYIQYVGVKELHDTTTAKAIVTVLAIPVAVIALYLAMLAAFVASMPMA